MVFNPLAGDHKYVVPPEAASTILLPAQMGLGDEGVMLMDKTGFTLTTTLAVAEHPDVVPVTV